MVENERRFILRELTVAKEHREDRRLVRSCNFAREPKAFELRPLLEVQVAHCDELSSEVLIRGRKRNGSLWQRPRESSHSACLVYV